MTSAANLLVDTHRLLLDDEHMDKMIFLRMSKRLMERFRTKKAFSLVMFSDILSGESETI